MNIQVELCHTAIIDFTFRLRESAPAVQCRRCGRCAWSSEQRFSTHRTVCCAGGWAKGYQDSVVSVNKAATETRQSKTPKNPGDCKGLTRGLGGHSGAASRVMCHSRQRLDCGLQARLEKLRTRAGFGCFCVRPGNQPLHVLGACLSALLLQLVNEGCSSLS